MKFLYTNVELNFPHHLSYVAALPCKCTRRILHVKLRVKIVCICYNFGNCCPILIFFWHVRQQISAPKRRIKSATARRVMHDSCELWLTDELVMC